MTQKKASRHRALTDVERVRNCTKSRVRARVEYAFLILKRIFGFNEARYRGLDEKFSRLLMASGLVNLPLVQRGLLRLTSGSCP